MNIELLKTTCGDDLRELIRLVRTDLNKITLNSKGKFKDQNVQTWRSGFSGNDFNFDYLQNCFKEASCIAEPNYLQVNWLDYEGKKHSLSIHRSMNKFGTGYKLEYGIR
jgi:hypothetical protein